MKPNYQDKIALVTGGSSGIGLATAKLLAQAGAHVWLLARRQDQLELALAEVSTCRILPSQRFGICAADVADLKQVNAAVSQVIQQAGLPDIVINSAGITAPGYIADQDVQIFRQLMEVNYMGIVHVTKAVLPGMLQRGSGYIINVGSMLSNIGMLAYTGYAGSKFAVRGFTDSLRAELKPKGIDVSIVYPPDTETPQLEHDMTVRPVLINTIFALDKPVKAEEVAKDIIRGLRRKEYVIVPGASNQFIYWLQWILGKHGYFVLDLIIGWAMRKTKGSNPG